jgi:prophage antirepressor-like protein
MVNNNQEQSNTNLSVFNFQSQEVRTVLIDNETRWVAADVCKVLDHSNVSMAVASLDDDEKGISNVYTLGGNQNMLCVTESGLYHLIFTSRKEEAKIFRRWVTNEVLPAIRKTGSYSMDNRSPKEQLQDQLGMLQFVHKIVRGVFRSLSQRWIVENKQFALYGKVSFDYFRLEVMRANREYSAVVKYFHGDNVFDGLNVTGDIVKMRSEIRNGEISVQLQFPFIEDAK